MIPAALSNHLWQSTVFAIAAALLTLTLRKNRAPVRYWLWFAASLKFLIPFSMLVTIGSQFEWRKAPVVPHLAVPIMMEQISQPFTPAAREPVRPATKPAVSIEAILLAAWLCGFSVVVLSWVRQWRRIRDAMRAGSPLSLRLPIRALSSPGRLEPGVFGIFRPVLLVPEGLLDRLTPEQWESILAHELCHVRRRDNLTAAMHMLVEAVCWFHPLVWWIGKQLVEERERACDEYVVSRGSVPEVYAEGILNVCKLYVESPIPCVSGVTGGTNLKKRIREIMRNRPSLRLTLGKKLLLTAVGLLVASVPIIVGLAKAQTSKSPTFEVASLREVPGGSPPAGLSLSPRRTGGRFTWTASLSMLAPYAYHLPTWRISGMDKDRSFYVVAATMDASATEDQVRLMLQALLVDRFKIVSHRETKEFQGYALVVGKNGPKLKTASASGEAPPLPEYFGGKTSAAFEGRIFTSMEGIGTSAVTGRGVSTSQLADELSENLSAFVLDQTGLTGKYYFGFRFQSVSRPSDQADSPSIFSAVQDELGLRLDKQKGPVEMLVVDHLEKPSEN